ncbi:hypothetical protein MKX03_037403 [Papaver bracteatum]|nr:hypothetical protein MKX03_037403 [Papaver bracteatum]
MPTLLGKIAVELKNLATTVNQGREIEVKSFVKACSTITSIVSHFGLGSVVGDLDKENYFLNLPITNYMFQQYPTLSSMLEAGIEQDNVLNLRRVIEVVKNLFQEILKTKFNDQGDNSLVHQGHRAYSKVFGDHLGDCFLTEVSEFLHLIPSKTDFLERLQETETSCADHMRNIVEAAPRITAYIDRLI